MKGRLRRLCRWRGRRKPQQLQAPIIAGPLWLQQEGDDDKLGEPVLCACFLDDIFCLAAGATVEDNVIFLFKGAFPGRRLGPPVVHVPPRLYFDENLIAVQAGNNNAHSPSLTGSAFASRAPARARQEAPINAPHSPPGSPALEGGELHCCTSVYGKIQ